MVGNKSRNGRISSLIVNFVLILVALACIVPVILVISISLSSMDAIYETGYTYSEIWVRYLPRMGYQ